ncbi:MAG: lipopolysaccharide biosynthesis protein [Armatimonadetes bacterium]|nr:lipopolysaccharide biosynthesis protein [Armatimonadota bacterium]
MRRFLPKSDFARDVLTLLTGTAAASILPLLAQPILSRLYLPIHFAPMGLFEGTFSIISIFATGRYEQGIVIPESDEDGAALSKLSTVLCLWVSLACLMIATFGWFVAGPDIRQWILLAPLGVLSAGLYQIASFWCIRKKNFKLMATSRVWRQTLIVVLWIIFGLLKFKGMGLILGLVIGQSISTAIIFAQILKDDSALFKSVTAEKLRQVAKRYSDFPRFSMAGGVLNAVTQALPRFVLYHYFGEAGTGNFTFAQKVAAAPASLLSTTFGDVFKQRASEELIANGNCIGVWQSTFKRLMIFGFAPAVILGLAAPWLFKIIFGPGYEDAGRLAQIMSPYIFLGFLASPLSRTIIVTEHQQVDLSWQIGLFLSTLLGLVIGSRTGQVYSAIGLYSLAYGAMYLLYLVISRKLAQGGTRKRGSR